MTGQVETRENKTVQSELIQDKQQEASAALMPKWQDSSPSYLAHVQALLVDLTEEDKDAIHASLQEE